MTKKSESLGVDREGVRPKSGLTNQQQEPGPARPNPFPPVISIEPVTKAQFDALVRAVGSPIALMVSRVTEADLSKGRGVLEGNTRCMWTKKGHRITISPIETGGLITSCSREPDPSAP